ncbi:uncharacterized protein LOC120145903 [Hibiscus syriacus]|uniref:uncharacterized protein LOC120145903 n=1 Tax=Hibiscus syriacus TaxID=106335 RepID=UPI0019231876|nr:uncharacterized protein LOC120145903 [Hibiscus syriacus]
MEINREARPVQSTTRGVSVILLVLSAMGGLFLIVYYLLSASASLPIPSIAIARADADLTQPSFTPINRDLYHSRLFLVFQSFGQHGRELITSELALRILSILSEEQFLPKMDRASLNAILENVCCKGTFLLARTFLAYVGPLYSEVTCLRKFSLLKLQLRACYRRKYE